ncbi:hypothetical protein [Cohaesibacter gelatinilyticus]|uniref:Uncharacterized protein n=1 Tax=Cohaesibacter gelatinilyticus TaxID=372072 RepID=A0A285PI38_9HYPH|nr:hypothetical protein [Cohaesibacter gelatinilyticus]SNZ21088.1 hypothetical protein SAMN06265368_4203 [Cohaesibacter gelatinilyticus]
MADYYAILKRAVVALPDSTREQRQAVYDKARNALLKQLQGMNPPLPPAEISKQRVALEEAVRSVERDLMLEGEAQENVSSAADAVEPTTPSAPVVSEPQVEAPVSQEPIVSNKAPTVSVSESPSAPDVKDDGNDSVDTGSAKEPLESEDRVVRRAGQDVLKNAVRDAEKLGTATSAAVKSAQETADIVGDQRKGEASRIEPTLGEAVVSSSKTYKASSPVTSVGADMDKAKSRGPGIQEEEKSSGFALFALVAVVAIVLGGSSYLLYQNKTEFLGSTTDGGSSVDASSEDKGSKEPVQSAEDKTDAKGEMVAKNVRTVTVTPEQDTSQQGETQSTSQPDQSDVSSAPVTSTNPNSEEAPAAEDQAAKVEDTGIQAIFYEENAAEGSDGQANPGQTVWNLEGEGEDAVVTIAVAVPKRDISFKIRMSKNKDASLPASHLIEIEVSKQGAAEDLKVDKIPGLIMKPTEGSRGQGLFGEPVRIADDLHWIALTSGPKALRYNLELLELRQWIDMPILFKSGRRGILTLRKGDSGNTVMESALRQWSK